MKLILGLGNPGKEYDRTRHNLGQALVARIIQKENLDIKRYPKLNCNLAQGQFTDKYLIGAPDSFMNLSGQAVVAALNYFKIPADQLLVIHDDLDIGVGEYKLQFDRSPAGHNGIKSIVSSIGSQGFWRLRLGIGHPRNSTVPAIPVEDYVLLPFTTEEKNQN